MATQLYETDLFFIAKIQGRFKDINVVKTVERLATSDADLLIVNLELNTQTLLDTLQELKEKNPKLHVVGYCAHIKQDIIKEAKEIGIDAMPRSVFVQKLPTL